jgi:hypothetical protein
MMRIILGGGLLALEAALPTVSSSRFLRREPTFDSVAAIPAVLLVATFVVQSGSAVFQRLTGEDEHTAAPIDSD